MELSNLTHNLVDISPNHPSVLCAIGNSFSGQRDHTTAIKYLQKATNLDNTFAYAFTLTGHEFMSKDDWISASECFRKAIKCDPRHYNAWYGLGTIYFKQERSPEAAYHFTRASEINKYNPVLLCNLGQVYSAEGKYNEALQKLSMALKLDPKFSIAKFQMALVLQELNRHNVKA